MATLVIHPVPVAGKEKSMEGLHKEFVKLAASGDLDYLDITLDGTSVGHMIVSEMADPDGVYRAHPTDPRQDQHNPHPQGHKHLDYVYTLVNKPV